DGAVDGVGLPVGGDDLIGDEGLAGLVGDAEGEGPLQRVVGVQPPYRSPRLPHRRPHPRRRPIHAPGAVARLHQVHLHHVPVPVLVLHQYRHVHRVRPLLHVERHRQPWILTRHPA
ncbi:Os03g0102775, partial [Oryza sativa Japonica Group]